MNSSPHFRWTDLLWFVLIVGLGVASRGWYLYECVNQGTSEEPPFVVQDGSTQDWKTNTELTQLVDNLREEYWFGCKAPLSPGEEATAHVAPGYPWMVYLTTQISEDDYLSILRWTQCVLGALTAGLYFVFVRLAFRSLIAALLAGILCAAHPFWIVNTAELADGVLVSFLLAVSLVSGTRAGQAGGAFTSLVYGLTLAGTVLVRAALLPFAFVGLLWFLGRCRTMSRGWLFGLLAVLGFANGVAPWTVRNYQTFHDILPIVNSAYLHLWIGNNSHANGGPMGEYYHFDLALPEGRKKELLDEPNQHYRYTMLAEDTLEYIKDHPTETVATRIDTSLYFFFGYSYLSTPNFRIGYIDGYSPSDHPDYMGRNELADKPVPDWLKHSYEFILTSVLLGMFLLGLLGWRWSYVWNKESGGLAALAVIWATIPYLLSHVGMYWGARLPLDGVFLSYSAIAVVCLVTGFRSIAATGPKDSLV